MSKRFGKLVDEMLENRGNRKSGGLDGAMYSADTEGIDTMALLAAQDSSSVFLENSELKERLKTLESQLASQSQPGGYITLAEGQRLTIGGVQVSPVGLYQIGDISEADLQVLGEILYRFKNSFQWLIGDWLNQAQIYNWAEVNRVAQHFRLQPKTLQNWKSICAKVPFSLRRERLDFNHHALVSALSGNEQAHWLEMAEQGDVAPGDPSVRLRWSVARLRAELHGDALQKVTPVPALLDKINRRRFNRIWRTIEQTAPQRIRRDDVRLLRAWLDEIEKLIPGK